MWSKSLGDIWVGGVLGDCVLIKLGSVPQVLSYSEVLKDSVFLFEEDIEIFFRALDAELGLDPLTVEVSQMTEPNRIARGPAPGHRPGEVWKTEGGLWRAVNSKGVAKSFETKEEADSHAKGHESEDENHNSDHGDVHSPEGSLKNKLKGFFGKLKDTPKSVKEFLSSAPPKVQKFVVDKEHRKEVTANMAEAMKKGAKSIPSLVKEATKDELKEIKDGVKAVKKIFKKPPEKLTGHDKKALYAVGAYVAASVVTGVTAGAGGAAAMFGKSFIKHVAFKAVSHAIDRGFTHFEVGESALHGFHHFTDHLASLKFSEDEEGDPLNETLVAYIHEAIRQVLEKGLSDEDMEEILKTVNEKTSSKAKEATLRGQLIRLAHSNPDLRPLLLPVIKESVDMHGKTLEDLGAVAKLLAQAEDILRDLRRGSRPGGEVDGRADRILDLLGKTQVAVVTSIDAIREGAYSGPLG
jgi:hypothetical protein